MNEPDSMGIGWEPANGKPGARELYLSTMDSLHDLPGASPWLYVVEGTGQNKFGLNWVREQVLQLIQSDLQCLHCLTCQCHGVLRCSGGTHSCLGVLK